MEQYVLAAIASGLEQITFLAHAEAGIVYYQRNWLDPELLDSYWAEGHELRRRYGQQLEILLGIELGINPRRVDELQQLAKRHRWDRIGLSYHYLPTEGVWLNMCSARRANLEQLQQRDRAELFLQYFSVLREHLGVLRPTMVCHLDVLRRNLDFPQFELVCRDIVEEILDLMVRYQVALEINTSGYGHKDEKPYPAEWIVAAAAQRGIELLLSSDSHHPSEVGRHFEKAVEYVHGAVSVSTGSG